MMYRHVENLLKRMLFTQTLMRKSTVIKGALLVFLFSFTSEKAKSQDNFAEQVQNLLNDAVFFTGKYVAPGSDATVYQAASSWVNTPMRKSLWDFTMGLHFNTFFV